MFGYKKFEEKYKKKKIKKKYRKKEKVKENNIKKYLKLINYFYILFEIHSINFNSLK